ncbi:hypothetical protein BUALT_Bualt01G0237700 [Buddleja alternifolia]|uniref:WRKY domain-containing protein n=1 Tax=Buddleja alternifolia TaxID=168488 RepID=A0AAV6Y9N1_9LAMI|nr:hypothetical protein BUALT_Bualt01G0237700 [Buddleja alternifolia]
MEKNGILERKTVISELTQGRELANELKKQLNPTKTSAETCDSLVEKILSSYDNALALLNCISLLENENPSQITWENTHNSIEGSPISEGSTPDCKNNSKKRKKMQKWSEQIRVCSETGPEGQIGDGYSWRKYGQKIILGAIHPRLFKCHGRAYYRCTHRHTQGCLATKQVQRADDVPSMFEVIYRGNHSCMQEKRLKQNNEKSQICIEPVLKTETQELDTKEENLPSFSFPSTENVATQFFLEQENFIGTSYSPLFLCPETSESYFSLSQCQVNDFAEIISNPTLIMNFPSKELDFSIDQVDFDPRFIDASDYF